MATYVDGRPRPFTAGAAGPEDFQSLSEHGQPLRPAVDSDSRKAYYKALNRLSKTVADLLVSMGREDPRHHDTPAPQRSGLAVYVAETTAETEEARAALCDDAESRREREPISGGCWPPLAEPMVRILFPPAASRANYDRVIAALNGATRGSVPIVVT